MLTPKSMSFVESPVAMGGYFTTAVTFTQIAAGAVIVKPSPGRLCRIIVTTTTTASQAITIYDNASAGSGTVIGIVPAVASTGVLSGTSFDCYMPAANGITIGQNASLGAGAITVSWI